MLEVAEEDLANGAAQSSGVQGKPSAASANAEETLITDALFPVEQRGKTITHVVQSGGGLSNCASNTSALLPNGSKSTTRTNQSLERIPTTSAPGDLEIELLHDPSQLHKSAGQSSENIKQQPLTTDNTDGSSSAVLFASATEAENEQDSTKI